jgi:CHAT domain
VLIEFREFRPVDFRTGKYGEPRFAAMLLVGSDEPAMADLGPVSEISELANSLGVASSAAPGDEAAAALYQRLFAPFESKLAAATSVYLAPDGILDLVPFARLKLADGRYWEEWREVHLLQTGRDLLRTGPDKTARGLLALGGIDFGAAAPAATKPDAVGSSPANIAGQSAAITRAAATFHDGFRPLPASGDEAKEIKEWYEMVRKDEPADAWLGVNAS